MRPDLILRHYIYGLLMGSADVVPGVSGGTVALIVGIYTRLIESIGREPLAQIAESYESSVAALFVEAQAALESQAFDVQIRCAHTIKSAALTVGMRKLAADSSALERDLRSDRRDGARAAFEALEAEFTRTLPLLAGYLRQSD